MNQNDEEIITLLAAQRVMYRRAKSYAAARASVSTALAIVSIPAALAYPPARVWIAAGAAFWTIVSKFALQDMEKSLVRDAATIQEQVDCQVLGIPWNKTLVGDRVDPEVAADWARKIPEDERIGLKDWYSFVDGLKPIHQTLIAQRSNLVWDFRQRIHFSRFLTGSSIFLFVSLMVIAIAMKLSLLDYLLVFFIPSLSAIVTGIDSGRAHREIATTKQRISIKIRNVFDQPHLEIPPSLPREIQDQMFILRNKTPMTPERLYKAFKPRFETQSLEAAHDLAKRVAPQGPPN